jgi:hypothetical protein
MMTAAEQGSPARPLDRTPEPASLSESFADQQVSYVDDVDSAAPQLPQDETGDFTSGSGVTPGRVAQNDDQKDGYAPAPQAASSYPHIPPSYASLRPADQPQRQAERDVEPPPSAGRETPSSYPPRQEAETPSYYRPWPQVPPMPYRAYRDRPDPPPAYPYYPAPRTYYSTPYPAPSYADPRYDDPRERYSER